MGSLLIVAGPKALATAGPTTHWVATSGTAVGTGTSCSNPGYVGTDQTPITAALSAAGAGDTVRVCAGTYRYGSNGFEDPLPSGVSLVGSGKGVTILDGDDQFFLLYIDNTEQFTLQDLTLTRGRDWYAAAMGLLNSSVAVVDVNFEDNHTDTLGGGAIHLENDSELTVIRSSFVGNTSASSGGGIDIADDETSSSLSIIDSEFTNNSAQTNGGAVNSAPGASLTLDNSRFHSNSAGSGGAIHTTGTATVSGSNFTNNTALGNGGAIFTDAYVGTAPGTTFDENTAGASGGAIYASSSVTVASATSFSNNTAVDGGAVAAVTTLTVTDGEFLGNSASGSGGAVHALQSVTSTSSAFTGNTAAAGDGGAIFAGSSATTTSTSFMNNESTLGDGGAINATTTATVMSGTFTNNRAPVAKGGAVYSGTSVTVSGDYFTSNIAGDGNDGNDVYAVGGGTVCGDVEDGPWAWETACVTGAGLNVWSVVVSVTGTGSGVIVDGIEGALFCDESNDPCTESYDVDTTVIVTATATDGSTFTAWSGADVGECTGSTCTFTSIAAAKAVTATFNTSGGGGGGGGSSTNYTLTVTPPRFGTISTADGVICTPSDVSCEVAASEGTVFTLTSSLQDGYLLDGWNGCMIIISETCSVTLNGNVDVSARYYSKWVIRFVKMRKWEMRLNAASRIRVAALALADIGPGDILTIIGYAKYAGANALEHAKTLRRAMRAKGITAPISITTAASQAAPGRRHKAVLTVVWGVTP